MTLESELSWLEYIEPALDQFKKDSKDVFKVDLKFIFKAGSTTRVISGLVSSSGLPSSLPITGSGTGAGVRSTLSAARSIPTTRQLAALEILNQQDPDSADI